MLFKAGRSLVERPNDILPWQYAHLGARVTWLLKLDSLMALNYTRGKPKMVFKTDVDYEPYSDQLRFSHIDPDPLEQMMEYNETWSGRSMLLVDWFHADPEPLELQVRKNGPGRLGTDPVIIPLPMKFTMEPARYKGEKELKCYGHLLDPNREWWYASTSERQEPNLYQWPWLRFWRTQAEYWAAQKAAYPSMIALAADIGVAVNKYLYKGLAFRDAAVWKFNGKLPDGYYPATAPELHGPKAKWDYFPQPGPFIDPRAITDWNSGPNYLSMSDGKVVMVNLKPN